MSVTVLQLISSQGFYGAENVLSLLSSALKEDSRYYPITGVFENSQDPHTEVAKECRRRGVETVIFPCKGKFDLVMLLKLRHFIRKKNIDIIHSHGYKATFYSFFAALFLSVSLIATCHNWYERDPKMAFYARLDRFFLRRFRKIVAVSEDVKRKVIDSGIRAGNVHVIDNGIETALFNVPKSRQILAEFALAANSTVIGTVGRLADEKGQEHLLNIIPIIQQKYPKAVFFFIGDGPLREDFQKKFGSSSVIFTGVRKDIAEFYRCMDVFVLPSLDEGLPMVILEAMASRLPIIASRVGAIPLVISDHDSGLLVEPRDEEGLTQALTYYLENPDTAAHMGEQALLTVRKKYSSAKMAQDYIDIYNTLSPRS